LASNDGGRILDRRGRIPNQLAIENRFLFLALE
jgi:hypothetical protein